MLLSSPRVPDHHVHHTLLAFIPTVVFVIFTRGSRCFFSAVGCTLGRRPRPLCLTDSSTSSSEEMTLVLTLCETCLSSSSFRCSTQTGSFVGTTGRNLSSVCTFPATAKQRGFFLWKLQKWLFLQDWFQRCEPEQAVPESQSRAAPFHLCSQNSVAVPPHTQPPAQSSAQITEAQLSVYQDPSHWYPACQSAPPFHRSRGQP